MNNKRTRAFTLVELLVVVSIVAALLTILMPALGRTREHAYRSYCQSKLNQLGVGWGMYNSDNDGYLCSPYTSMEDAKMNNSWVADGNGIDYSKYKRSKVAIRKGALFSYVGSADVYSCRAGKKARGYSMSYTVGGGNDNDKSRDGMVPYKQYGEIPKPGSQLVFVDGETEGDYLYRPFWPIQLEGGEYIFRGFDKFNGQHMTDRHSNGTNFIFADLHCEYYKYRDHRTLEFIKLRPTDEKMRDLQEATGNFSGIKSAQYYSGNNADVRKFVLYLKGK